jgi:type IV pilus assembly protein PilC
MPAYSYRAVHNTGRVTRGTATAANESELAQSLGHAQLELIEARESREPATRGVAFRSSFRATPPRALALFCSQTADLLKAGMVLLDALADLAAMMESGALRDALYDVTRSLSHGSRIAEAFARHPRVFPKVFIAILAAGEASGDIGLAFEQLAAYVESRARMNERLSRALRYPLFLLAVAFGVTTFMMVLVVPQIVSFLNSIEGQLPPATRVLIAVSNMFGAVWWMMGLALIGGALLAVCLHRTSSRAARFLDGLFLRLPVVGAVMEKLMLARFAQSFAILVQSGLTIPESLQGARDTLGNRALEVRLDTAAARVTAGSPLSSALAELLPPFALRIMRVGEQGGRLPKSLDDIAVTYDREAGDSVDRMIGALEPGLTLLIGGLLAWVVLAVLGPIYGSLATINCQIYRIPSFRKIFSSRSERKFIRNPIWFLFTTRNKSDSGCNRISLLCRKKRLFRNDVIF